MKMNSCHKSLYVAIALISGTFTVFSNANSAGAITVSPNSYSYDSAPSVFYPDTGGTELTDGIIATLNWNGTLPGSNASTIPYSGWQNTEPTITFDFGGVVNIETLIFSFDDANGAGAVTTPDSIDITMGGTTISRAIVDPASSEPITQAFSGLGLTGTSLDLKVFNAQSPGTEEWTMISEVSFDSASVPFEFSPSLGLLAVGGIFGVAKYRKIKAAQQDLKL